MRVYSEVVFLSSDKQSFTSNEGEYVEYYENTLKGDGGVVVVNSKADFKECEMKSGIAEIEAKPQDNGKGFKMTLKSFSTGDKLDLPEEVVT